MSVTRKARAGVRGSLFCNARARVHWISANPETNRAYGPQWGLIGGANGGNREQMAANCLKFRQAECLIFRQSNELPNKKTVDYKDCLKHRQAAPHSSLKRSCVW